MLVVNKMQMLLKVLKKESAINDSLDNAVGELGETVREGVKELVKQLEMHKEFDLLQEWVGSNFTSCNYYWSNYSSCCWV